MEHVTSADGTRIAVHRNGSGPPLVVVHGTTSDHTSWDPVLPALGEHFSVYAVDRRGRGESGGRPEPRPGDRPGGNASGGGDEYAIEREFEDLVAVCSSIDGPVDVLGHSYGALVALGAAPDVPNLRRLVLYEPPLRTGERPGVPEPTLDRMEELAASGENEAVLETFFRDVAGSEERLQLYRSQPEWDRRLAAAPTVPRENRATGRFEPDPEAYASVTTPALVLLGGESGAFMTGSTEAAEALLPNGELVVLEGEGHAAMYTAPERFVSTVVSFLSGDE